MDSKRRFCDRITRRDWLQVGGAGLMGIGMTLPELLAREAAADPDARAKRSGDVSLIFVFLKGGLSTIDTWDLKPNAPAEFRGEFNPIDSCVPGIQIGEHMPLTARHTDKFSLIRSFTHTNSDHGPADHYMLTGYHPRAGFNPSLTPNNQFPSHGSIIARSLGPRRAVPPYVCLPKMHPSAASAYLGPNAAPFVINANPNSPGFTVPDLSPPLVLDSERLDARRELLGQVDRFQRSAEARSNARARDLSVFREKAIELMTSAAAKEAFNIHAESDEVRESYGRTSLGQSCLMARRLVEAGVRCVTVNNADWDTHYNNFKVLKGELLPGLDLALSGLFADLAQRGLLSTTLVVVSGEFGRTPRINGQAGRDHWGPGFTVVVGGGGVQGGRIIGRSNERAEKPASDPHGPEDLAATMYHLLGIDPEAEFLTAEGRPVKIVNDGRVIDALL